eukprot:scaffold314133_cov15-Prasinocladus_malaysianus.AAC.1
MFLLVSSLSHRYFGPLFTGQGGTKLNISAINPMVAFDLAEPFSLKGWSATNVKIYMTGAL